MLIKSRNQNRGLWACLAAMLVSASCSGTSGTSAPQEGCLTETSQSVPSSVLVDPEENEQSDISLSVPVEAAAALAISGA